MRIKSTWLLPFAAIAVVAAGVALLWWRSDVAAGHWWQSHGTNVLKFAIPPMIAVLAWAFKQIVSSRPERSTLEQLSAAQEDLAARGLEWWRGIPQPAWPGYVLRAGLGPLAGIRQSRELRL
jgi:ABC-type sulfate transport system permease subunit